jgi:hypothetical protein
MRANHLENNPPEDGETEEEACEYYEDRNLHGDLEFGGSMIECYEGAIWKAQELEDALRVLVNPLNSAERDIALEKAKALLAEIDGI